MPVPLRSKPWPLPPAVWRADELGHQATPGMASGFAPLDAQLPGSGWPVGALTELIARDAGIGELRLLVPLLRRLTTERRVVLLLAPPHVPYAPALEAFGIDPNWVIVVQAANAADRLWAVEQTLKNAAFGALLAWLPHEQRTRPEQLRRMQLAAASSSGAVFLFRPLAAQLQPSPAPLRLLLLPRPNEQLSVQILKRRGPLLAQPLLLDLPQPVSGMRLRGTPVQARDAVPSEAAESARPDRLSTLMVAHPLLARPGDHAALH